MHFGTVKRTFEGNALMLNIEMGRSCHVQGIPSPKARTALVMLVFPRLLCWEPRNKQTHLQLASTFREQTGHRHVYAEVRSSMFSETISIGGLQP